MKTEDPLEESRIDPETAQAGVPLILEELRRPMAYSIVRTCTNCRAKNRVPASRLADAGRCGACKAPLGPADEPMTAGDEVSLDGIIHEASVPVLVDFWAEWCGPCRMSGPEVQELAREMAGKALVLKVDIEAHPELAARFGIQAIPYFLVFRDGKLVFQRAGAAPRQEMRQWLELAGPAAA
jgi:thioredoxin 2